MSFDEVGDLDAVWRVARWAGLEQESVAVRRPARVVRPVRDHAPCAALRRDDHELLPAELLGDEEGQLTPVGRPGGRSADRGHHDLHAAGGSRQVRAPVRCCRRPRADVRPAPTRTRPETSSPNPRLRRRPDAEVEDAEAAAAAPGKLPCRPGSTGSASRGRGRCRLPRPDITRFHRPVGTGDDRDQLVTRRSPRARRRSGRRPGDQCGSPSHRSSASPPEDRCRPAFSVYRPS